MSSRSLRSASTDIEARLLLAISTSNTVPTQPIATAENELERQLSEACLYHIGYRVWLVRHHRHNDCVFVYAFDLIGLNCDDMRRDPLQVRKARRCGDKFAYRFALVSAGGRMVAAGRQPGKRSSAVSGRTASTAPAREKSCKARTRSSGSPTHPAVPVSGALQI